MQRGQLERLIGRLRSHHYTSLAELQQDLAAGLAALEGQPGEQQKIKREVLAGIQGGTTLGVGNPYAGYISDYLVQNPTGPPTNTGMDLLTRRQTRIETNNRILPAIVTRTATAGDDSIGVKVVGLNPTKETDPITGVEIVGDPWKQLADLTYNPDIFDPDAIDGEEFEIPRTGQEFVPGGNNGVQAVRKGQTTHVMVSDQYQVDLTWTERLRKWLPEVVRKIKRTVSFVNDFQYQQPRSCTKQFIFSWGNSPHGFFDHPIGNYRHPDFYNYALGTVVTDWHAVGFNLFGPGVAISNTGFWRIIEFSFDRRSPCQTPEYGITYPPYGTQQYPAVPYDPAVNGPAEDLSYYTCRPDIQSYPWIAAGRIGPGGELLGFPDTTLDDPSIGWSVTYETSPPWRQHFFKGQMILTGCSDGEGWIHWLHAMFTSHAAKTPEADFPP